MVYVDISFKKARTMIADYNDVVFEAAYICQPIEKKPCMHKCRALIIM